jgi:uncharacterized cupredoxin-like copper-binding protein
MTGHRREATRMRRAFAVAVVAALTLATACSSGGSTGGAAGKKIATTLDDYSITPSPASVPAGAVTFEVENVGATEHEMVVIRTDLDPADIPVEDHEANEEAPGMTPVGEVEDVQPGASTDLKLTLESGSYVLLCNIKKHFERGMVTQFEVT